MIASLVSAFALASPSFHAGQPIPSRYTCDGRNVSPPLEWAHAPARTRTFAVRLEDPDAPGGTFTHWTLWNVPGRIGGLAQGVRWSHSGSNSFGRIGYSGPCPPSGPAHRYVFRLYALNASLTLGRGASLAQFAAAVRAHVIATARLVGTYRR